MGCLTRVSVKVKNGMTRLSALLPKRRTSSTSPLIPETTKQPVTPPPRYAIFHSTKAVQNAPSLAAETPSSRSGTLTVNLENQTASDNVFAYITGRAIDNNNAVFLLRADAKTPYYPESPSDAMQPLGAECAIKLGPPGSTIVAQIPHITGGRIWFSTDRPISFFLNPGPELVEPAVGNQADSNHDLNWGFAELTWNTEQLYANISYVDFVSIPIALTLDTLSNITSHVSGMKPEGLQQIADNLRRQKIKDGQGWDQLIVNQPGTDNKVLRILSPGQAMKMSDKLFDSYYDTYVDHVYERFAVAPISIDTQMKSGVVSAQVNKDIMDFGGSSFQKPTTRDIFMCDTGPFVTGRDLQTNAIILRLAAEFNRSTLLSGASFPSSQDTHYNSGITNHYSRIVHEANLDGRGSAFPYDDVQPTDGRDQSGAVHARDPKALTVTVGGVNAHTL